MNNYPSISERTVPDQAPTLELPVITADLYTPLSPFDPVCTTVWIHDDPDHEPIKLSFWDRVFYPLDWVADKLKLG